MRNRIAQKEATHSFNNCIQFANQRVPNDANYEMPGPCVQVLALFVGAPFWPWLMKPFKCPAVKRRKRKLSAAADDSKKLIFYICNKSAGKRKKKYKDHKIIKRWLPKIKQKFIKNA